MRSSKNHYYMPGTPVRFNLLSLSHNLHKNTPQRILFDANTPIHLLVHQIRRSKDRNLRFGIHPYFFTKDLLKTFSCFPNTIYLFPLHSKNSFKPHVPQPLPSAQQPQPTTSRSDLNSPKTTVTTWKNMISKTSKNHMQLEKKMSFQGFLELTWNLKKKWVPKLGWYMFSYRCGPLQPSCIGGCGQCGIGAESHISGP